MDTMVKEVHMDRNGHNKVNKLELQVQVLIVKVIIKCNNNYQFQINNIGLRTKDKYLHHHSHNNLYKIKHLNRCKNNQVEVFTIKVYSLNKLIRIILVKFKM